MKQSTIRFFQKHIMQIMDFIKFKVSTLTIGEKISLWALMICSFSLFIPWIRFISNWDSTLSPELSINNSFSSIIWNSGVFIGFGICLGLFFLFSTKNREKIHSLIPVSRKVHNIIFYIALYIITISLHTIFMIIWLQTFAANIVYWKWIILCLTGGIILLFWALQIKKDISKSKKWTYLNEAYNSHSLWDSQESEDKRNNMKLPF